MVRRFFEEPTENRQRESRTSGVLMLGSPTHLAKMLT